MTERKTIKKVSRMEASECAVYYLFKEILANEIDRIKIVKHKSEREIIVVNTSPFRGTFADPFNIKFKECAIKDCKEKPLSFLRFQFNELNYESQQMRNMDAVYVAYYCTSHFVDARHKKTLWCVGIDD